MLTIDGSFGEGGGQIVRSSLALSLVTARPVTLEKIRAGRKKPGLMRQHLTAVDAAAQISGATVDGATLGSKRLVFEPGPVRGGSYEFNVGTAGSTSLVLETVLPALLSAEGPSQLVLEGGTHNPLAPPFDFLAKTFLPLVNRMGPTVGAELVRPGFFPAGGGKCTFRITPSPLRRLELVTRGPLLAPRVRVLLSKLPRHIAERECRTIAANTSWDEGCFSIEEVADSRGPGNCVMIELESPHVCEVSAGFGQLGVRAEAVAAAALDGAQRYLNADVPVGEHLADQLLLPLGIGAWRGTGGGEFRTLPLSLHATTHIEILRRFLNVRIEVTADQDGACLVRVG
jgi:RNA 3'-terminal phosphate cyclase (ATP)